MKRPKDSDTATFDPATQTAPSAAPGALYWISPPGLALTRLEPNTDAVMLGRAPECRPRIDSDHVSRRHAEILCDGPLWLIRDLGSHNGCLVNGRRVSLAPLAVGDVVRIGDAVAVVLPLELAAGSVVFSATAAAEHDRRVRVLGERWGLTARETQILSLVCRGDANKTVASRAGCAESTVELHVTRILEKAGAASRAALIALFWSSSA